MKKFNLILLMLLVSAVTLMAQVPEAMKYQSVIRNSSGQPLADTNVGLRLTVLQNGSDVYQETYDINTNSFGMVNVNLGQGNTSDNFSSINWTTSNFELQIEVDTDGGSNYQLVGSSSMLSVPFAMHAQTAENVDDADASPTNEIQTLSVSGNQLSITGGNTVTLDSGGGADEDALAKVYANVDVFGNSNTAFDNYGVTSVNKTSTGVYNISLEPGLFSTAVNPSVVCSIFNDLSPGVAIPTFSSSPSQITVRTYDMSGNLSDRGFSIIVFGL